MKIYIVTSGDYEYYHINKVFTNKEKAEEYSEWLDEENQIEEKDIEDDLQIEKYHYVVVELIYYISIKETIVDVTHRKTLEDEGSYNWYETSFNGDRIKLEVAKTVKDSDFNSNTIELIKEESHNILTNILQIKGTKDSEKINKMINKKGEPNDK